MARRPVRAKHGRDSGGERAGLLLGRQPREPSRTVGAPRARAALLVIDLGLSNCRAVFFSPDGDILASGSTSFPTVSKQHGWVEQDPEAWWEAVRRAVRDSRVDAVADLPPVVGISVTGQMHALVCVGPKGRPLRPAMVLGDQRAASEVVALERDLSPGLIYRITGTRMNPSMPAAKLRWLRVHSPEVVDGASLLLSCKDYIRHRLTGDALTDASDACATSLFDLETGTWSPELVRLAGVRVEQLPTIAASTQLAGGLSSASASALGLPAGTPVLVGAGDDVAVLGGALTETGVALEHIGTTGSVFVCADSRLPDPEMALESYPPYMEHLWVVGGSNTTAGAAIGWAAATLGYGSVAEALRDVTDGFKRADSSPVFLPYMAGERAPRWRTSARGGWVGLEVGHGRADMFRAVLEGVTFSMHSILARADALLGRHREVLIAGRGLDSSSWVAMRAATYGRPIRLVSVENPTALGAMLLAAVGVGLEHDLRSAIQQVVRLQTPIEPEPAAVEFYAGLYEQFSRLVRLDAGG